jgi:hypothetical protein
VDLAAGLVVRYGRKVEGQEAEAEVLVAREGKEHTLIAAPLADDTFRAWLR